MDSHDYEKKNYLSQWWKTIHKIVKKAKKKMYRKQIKSCEKKEKLQKMAGDQSKGLWRREK